MSQQSNAAPAFVHPYGLEREVDIADPKVKAKKDDDYMNNKEPEEYQSLEEALLGE